MTANKGGAGRRRDQASHKGPVTFLLPLPLFFFSSGIGDRVSYFDGRTPHGFFGRLLVGDGISVIRTQLS